MYQGFKLRISDSEREALLRKCDLAYDPINATVGDGDMEKALLTDNANWIMDNWFRNYDADIFMSHSHGDEELARKVSAIFNEMGLRVFIDSDVWGYSDKMLRKIDNMHCGLKFREDGTVETYDYNKRNKTTSHVHILLTHALMRMITQTECFIFLETGNSSFRSTKKELDTYSPWLFHELAFANVVEQQKLSRKRYCCPEKVAMDESVTEGHESFALKFSANVEKLRRVSLSNLLEQVSVANRQVALHSRREMAAWFLDHLYQNWNE